MVQRANDRILNHGELILCAKCYDMALVRSYPIKAPSDLTALVDRMYLLLLVYCRHTKRERALNYVL